MHSKILLCPLTVTILGGVGYPAVANPVFQPSQTELTTPTWTDSPKQPATSPNWTDSTPEAPETRQQQETEPVLVPLTPPNNEAQTTPIEENSELEAIPEPAVSQTTATDSPLGTSLFQQPTAEHLRQGEFVIDVNNRLFFPPDSLSAAGQEEGTAVYFDGSFTWAITDSTQIRLGFQHVDSAGPGRQGDFDVIRTDDNEAALEVKQRLWQNSDETLALSGVFSLSVGPRGFRFRQDGRVIDEEEDLEIVPALGLPLTATVSDRLKLTLSPTVAFFSEERAAFLPRLPGDNEEFGTTFGFVGAVSYSLNSRLTLWGDAFIPVTGNNSVSRSSGEPDSAIAYNAGLRYLVNPQLAVDIFASNTLGSIGPVSLTADRDLTAFGASIVFMPDFVAANRRYADDFEIELDREATPIIASGLGFFDGGTLASRQFLANILGGSQGIFTSLRYGFVEDFEGGIYLDYAFGDVDESEQGLSGKIGVLSQATGDPLTASVAATISLPNQPFVNFTNSDPDEFDERDLDKEVPFILQGDDNDEGQLYIFTLSVPLDYQFNNGAAVWFTPTWGYVQRNGTEIAGFNLGGSIPVGGELSVLGEVGANFADEGNTIVEDGRENRIPWTVGLRWDPSSFLGIEPKVNPPQLEFYVTNRVGFSSWHQLRVQEENETAVGVGLSVPF